jgi:hypothetical protein
VGYHESRVPHIWRSLIAPDVGFHNTQQSAGNKLNEDRIPLKPEKPPEQKTQVK